jgi:parallel beta-helix repeat protein
MSKNIALLLVLVLTASSIVSLLPVKAEYSGTITIGSDGNVSPSISSIQQSGNTYFLTADIAGNITVQKSNIVLDGNGYKADSVAIGLDTTTGISNVTVKNFIIDGTSGFAFNRFDGFGGFGIMVNNGSNVLLTNNTIINTRHPGVFVSNVGIYIVGGSSNKVIGNNLENNSDGLSFSRTRDNVVTENNITANHGWFLEFTCGISFFDASNNLIFNNNFIDNYNDLGNYAQVGSRDSINMWDDGIVGNYWSDYDGIDANRDGIGDMPYEVDSENTDRYPLIKPSSISVYLQKTTPPKVALLSPINQVFNESSVSLIFTVDKQVNWMGYSLDCQDNVTVTGNVTLSELTNGVHNVTVYAEDTFGNEGASETIIFNIDVPEPFPTILVVASIITVAIIGIVLLVYFKKRHAKSGG